MRNIANPLTSIVVPIYNASQTLRRCIDSILQQTFVEFELLLINDGSKDNSGAICDEYAQKDKRVRVFHKENGGVSSARNLGLDNVQGEWVTFIDSDDWVAHDYIENLYASLKIGTDLVISFSTLIHNDGGRQKPSNVSSLLVKGNFQSLFVDYNLHIYTSPWGKLYKRSIIEKHSMRFCEEMHIGEDLLFLYSYMLNVEKIYLTSYSGYYYCFELSDTLTKRINSFESEYVGYKNISNVIDRIEKEWFLESNVACRNLGWVRGYYTRRVLNALYYNKVIRSERIALIRRIDKTSYLRCMNITSYKEKIFACLLRLRLYQIYDLTRSMICLIKR